MKPDDRFWWKESVVYQIYPRSFQDSNGDGIGDLRGIIQRLPYLAYLGVDVVWLSPMFASPNDDNGYDISDYRAVAAEFGTLDDMRELLAEARLRGIRIILDLVANHTSDEHAWFVESRRSRDSAKREWYLWKPGQADHPPTDWPSMFGGSAWEFDATTNEYYLHSFSKKQPDLNWEHPPVREALYEMMNWWIDQGIAGFRVDAITYIKKDLTWPRTIAKPPHLPCNEPGILDFLGEMRDRVFSPRGMMTVAEAPGIAPESLGPYIGEDQGVFSMIFTFDHVDIDARTGRRWHYEPWTLPELKRTLSVWQHSINRSGWLGLYLENHDHVRSVSKFGDEGRYRAASAKALATWYFLMRGTPFLYQGQELGMTNTPFVGIGEYRDVSAKSLHREASAAGWAEAQILEYLARRSRDHNRTPMPWNSGPGAGFSTVEPWIKLNPSYPSINVENQTQDPDSVLHHYRRLIQLRRSEPVLVHGTYEDLNLDSGTLACYRRQWGSERVTVLCNFSAERTLLPEPANGTVVLNSGVGFDFSSLDPWQSVVLKELTLR